ncbi:hypothetical protein MLJ63_08865 [Saccharolobus shibatae]|uniref:hypothetical protein n=1 Tax=Saccharolobus shibatae TaxID=2286 RepID=UPI001F0FAD09|nr:hypothetical protein [Saccharolobus shibatae]MCH4815858.1 hypothetical protein [Saccharolobus shibatae]
MNEIVVHTHVTIGNVIYVPYPRTYTITSNDLSKGVLDVNYNVSSPPRNQPPPSQKIGKTNVQTGVKISKFKQTVTAGVILSIIYIIVLIVAASEFQYFNTLFEALAVMDIFFQLTIMGLLISAVSNPYKSHKRGLYVIIISIIMFFFSIPILGYTILFIIFDIAAGISLARFKRR